MNISPPRFHCFFSTSGGCRKLQTSQLLHIHRPAKQLCAVFFSTGQINDEGTKRKTRARLTIGA